MSSQNAFYMVAAAIAGALNAGWTLATPGTQLLPAITAGMMLTLALIIAYDSRPRR